MSKAGKIFFISTLTVGLTLTAFDAWTKMMVGLFDNEQLILIFIFVASALLTIVLFITDFIYKKRYKTIPLIITVSLLVGYLTADYSNDYFFRQRKTNAYKIINGVSKYFQDNKTYPDSLTKLIPTYLSYIPEMRFGLRTQEYEYVPLVQDGRQHFVLTWYNFGEFVYYDTRNKSVTEHPLPW